MSVEDHNIEDEFDKILQDKDEPELERVVVPPVLAALLCYCVPIFLLMGTFDYRKENVLIGVLVGAVVGTGFFIMHRYNAITKAFLNWEKPSKKVIMEVQAQAKLDRGVTSSTLHFATDSDGELDWDNIVTKIEDDLNGTDTLNVSTLFDHSKHNDPHAPRESWLKRLFRRK